MRALAVSVSVVLSGATLAIAVAQDDDPAAAAYAWAGPMDLLPPDQQVSDTLIDLAGWVIATGDNENHPFTIIDKAAAQILVFGADGRLRGAAPVLIGSAIGDHSAPGVAERELHDIPMEDRTTPAGRFIAGYGPAAGGKTALWIDYDNAISIHAITNGNEAEKRPDRLASPDPEDNRITHGCINVAAAFYEHVVSPSYAEGGVFYILPDVMALGEAIPGFGAQPEA